MLDGKTKMKTNKMVDVARLAHGMEFWSFFVKYYGTRNWHNLYVDSIFMKRLFCASFFLFSFDEEQMWTYIRGLCRGLGFNGLLDSFMYLVISHFAKVRVNVLIQNPFGYIYNRDLKKTPRVW
jgi:hypothetical protein